MLRLYAGVGLVLAGIVVVLEFKVFHIGLFNGFLP